MALVVIHKNYMTILHNMSNTCVMSVYNMFSVGRMATFKATNGWLVVLGLTAL